MHNVDLGTQIVFAVERRDVDCFVRGEGPAPVPAALAGFRAAYVEPYRRDRVATFQPELT